VTPSVAPISAQSRLPLGAFTDAAVMAYAAWTLAANAAVFVGGGTRALVVAFAISVVAAIGVMYTVATNARVRRAYLADLGDDPIAPRAPAAPAALLRMLCLPAFTAVAWLATHDAWIAWAGCAVSTVYAVYCALREPPAPEAGAAPPPVLSRRERIALHALALACAAFSLLVVRPRADDTFYLNMAVSVVDHPEQALLAFKNLHGPASDTLAVQRMFPPYRVHSFELLGGVLSYLTGVEAVRVVHFGLATLLCWFTPFAVARLLRLLAPRAWLLGVVVVIAFYMIEGTASRGYANHALVRMFNGKSAMLTLAMPLLIAAGLRYAARPSPLRFALLAAAQIAAVGLSSTALWWAPVVATLSVAAGTPGARALPRRLLGGVASSAYVLALGVWVFSQLGAGAIEPGEAELAVDQAADGGDVTAGGDQPEGGADRPTGGADSAAVASTQRKGSRFDALSEAFEIGIGTERTSIALLAVALSSSALAPTVLGMRLFALLGGAVAVGFANPLLGPWIARYVTGVTTYARVFWLLPVAVGLGTNCAALFSALRAKRGPFASAALSLAAAAVFLAVATDRLVISQANQARLQFPPALKLWPHARAEAEAVCRYAPEDTCVLASQALSLQLPIMHRCGYPLATFDRWMSVSPAEFAKREELVQLMTQREDLPASKAQWFVAALARYRVGTIVLGHEAVHDTRMKALIRLANFERVAMVDWDQIFTHPDASKSAAYERVAREVCRLAPRSHAVLAPFGVAAAVARRKCVPVLTEPKRVLKAPAGALDELLDLERYVASASEAPREVQQVESALSRHDVATVVLGPLGKSNKWWKAILAARGFRKVQGAGEYSIMTRPIESAEP
jgi:hypothetical protein